MKRKGAGRWILSSAATLTAVGGFLADWNRTHLFNPNWPPHAKNFMMPRASSWARSWVWAGSTCCGEGASTRRVTSRWAPYCQPFSRWPRGRALSSPGLRAEFPEKVPQIRGLWLNERVPSALMLVLIAVGYLAERGRQA